MAKKILVKSAIKRQTGKLYFIDKAGNVVETSMNRKGGKKGRKICSAKAPANKKTATKKTATKKKRVTAKRAPAKRKAAPAKRRTGKKK